VNPDRINTILIVGGGTAGWMSAAVLARAFGRSIEVGLVESEQIGTVGVGEATIPQIRLINRYLGVDENEFLQATHGTFKLGIRFDGWTSPGHSYIHAFGEIGRGLDIVPFHHYWLRARAESGALDLWHYSLNAESADRNAFARIDPGRSPVPSGINYAFHFDASRYAGFLRHYAERRGVTRVEGRVGDISMDAESGQVRELVLDDGRRLAADLFIDCSGFRGLLIEQALATGYVDWTHWLPCDRAAAVATERTEPLAPYTRSIARPAGWQWRIPLQHRTGNGHVFCSRFIGEDEAVAVLLAHLDAAPQGDPRVLRFTTGHRKRFWNRNVVAIGLAAGFMEPLESTSIHLIQAGISRLLKLFPDRRFDPSLAEVYNQQTAHEFERIRDFLILHYHANGRVGEPFWDERRAMAIPDVLGERIALFRASGQIVRDTDELFTEQSWLQLFIGQGIEPQAWHAQAEALEAGALAEFLGAQRRAVKRTAAQLPDHADYLRRSCKPGQSPAPAPNG